MIFNGRRKGVEMPSPLPVEIRERVVRVVEGGVIQDEGVFPRGLVEAAKNLKTWAHRDPLPLKNNSGGGSRWPTRTKFWRGGSKPQPLY